MPTYIVEVTQEFEVIASSIQEAYKLLPEYIGSPGQSWNMIGEYYGLKETIDVATR